MRVFYSLPVPLHLIFNTDLKNDILEIINYKRFHLPETKMHPPLKLMVAGKERYSCKCARGCYGEVSFHSVVQIAVGWNC